MSIYKQSGIIKAVVVLIIAGVGMIALPKAGGLLKEWQDDALNPSQMVVSYCSVTVGCTARLDGATIDLSIQPNSVPEMKPLDMVVTLTGLEARKVTIEFAGQDMPVVLESVTLTREEQGAEKERYTGTGQIPFCTSDKSMVWLARINITTKTTVQTVVFELDT